ncbi:hypothetical protein AO275_24930 [Pseudomonas viridiflava]|nr:hypothetical protein AO275_24930 [Pseudomonas viridiflava]
MHGDVLLNDKVGWAVSFHDCALVIGMRNAIRCYWERLSFICMQAATTRVSRRKAWRERPFRHAHAEHGHDRYVGPLLRISQSLELHHLFRTPDGIRKCLETHGHNLKQDTGGDLMRWVV